MPFGLTDDEIDFILEGESREAMRTIEMAKTRLQKLTVAELRVLAAHYWKGRPADYSDMGKPDLVDELADTVAADLFDL